MDRLEFYDGYGGLFKRKDTIRRRFPRSELRDLFLFDTNTAENLAMAFVTSDSYRGHESSLEERHNEPTLFRKGGLVDKIEERSSRARMSLEAKRMLARMILLPERHPQAIYQRQQIFRAFEDPEVRNRFLRFFTDDELGPTHRSHQGFVEILTEIRDRTFDRDESDNRYRFFALRNLGLLLGELEKTPGLSYVYSSLSEVVTPELLDLLDYVGSDSKSVEFDRDFSGMALRYGPAGSQVFAPMMNDKAIFGPRGFGESLSKSIIHDLLEHCSGFGGLSRLIDNVAALEAVLHYSDYIHNFSKRSWCLPKIIDTGAPGFSFTDFYHPLYLDTSPPNSFAMGGEDGLFHLLVSANNSGKSALLITLGQLLALGQAGFPLPMQYGEISPVNHLHANFRPRQTTIIGEYVKHLGRWMSILSSLDRAIILADQPNDGTQVPDAVRHLGWVTDTLYRRNVPTVLTTHHLEIADSVIAAHGAHTKVYHMGVGFDQAGNITYTYRLEPGLDRKNYGDLAGRQVGFTKENLERIANNLPPLRPGQRGEGVVIIDRFEEQKPRRDPFGDGFGP
jgi:hypothetical protein